jgi:aspartate-semialdehyde dehydrogenase
MTEKIIDKKQLEKLAPNRNECNIVLEDNIEPVRIHVHPTLEDEFKFWKFELEKIAGYEITGGKPTVSKVCAYILKNLRTKKSREEKRIVIEIRKVIGLKKVKITIV